MTRFFKGSVGSFCVVFLAAAMFVSPVFASQGDAQTAISTAKNAIKDCYEAVKQAEVAGANVDSLMVTLNDAAGLLSKAELAYASRDYDSAYNYATQSQSILGDLQNQASTLAATAQANDNQNFVYTIFSVVVSVGILCAGISGWIVSGRRERRRIYGHPTI